MYMFTFKHLTDLRPGHLDSRAIGTVVGVLSGDMWGLGHPGHLCHNGGVLWMVFFAIIYLACHKLGFLLDFSTDILQLKRSLKCVLLVTLSGHRNVTMKPHLAMWPG